MATEIITGLNPDIRPCLVNFKDWCFFVDGDNVSHYFDQNGGFIWMHTDPSTAITANEAVAGDMNGVVKYIYTEYNKTSGDGDMHSGHETNPSAVYTTGTLVSKKVTLTLPATADNTGFTHLKVYATDEDGEIYYYIGSVAIGTTTLEDNGLTRDANYAFGELTTSNAGVVTQTYLNYRIPNVKFILATKTRILAFGTRPKTDGTVAVTNASATVTGTSSLWTDALKDCTIYVDNESRGYVVDSVDSATQITLSETYAGSTDTGLSYEIVGNDSTIYYSAKHPYTAKPLFWAFPANYYRRIRRQDYTEFMGGGLIGDQPVIFKKYSHYMLTENGDDFIDTESNTKVGTCSHWSIVNDPSSGSLVFLSNEGLLYKTNGLEATYLGVDLSKTVDGINTSRLEETQAIWLDTKKWYILIYTSNSGSATDRILIYDFRINQWVIWQIRSNCIAMIESQESSQSVWKPWIGTVGGFVYKLLTGNNLGADSGTLSGTVTGGTSTTLTDSGASFYTSDDGLKDVYVSIFDSNSDFVEEQQISSNTGTVLTTDTWTTTPTTSHTYEIGSIRWYWKSKVFDFGADTSKCIRNVLINFTKVSSSRNVKIKFYVSEDPDMPSSSNQDITFDLSYDYHEPLSLYDNRGRYFQFEITGHGTNDPVTINSIVMNIMEYFR